MSVGHSLHCHGHRVTSLRLSKSGRGLVYRWGAGQDQEIRVLLGMDRDLSGRETDSGGSKDLVAAKSA
eukprot:3606514-Rhodomonas_salina.1